MGSYSLCVRFILRKSGIRIQTRVAVCVLYEQPYKFIDPDGKIWVNANKNKVWDNGRWTAYATPQMKEIGRTLLSTPTGKKQFDKLVSNPVEISITLVDSGDPTGHVFGKAKYYK